MNVLKNASLWLAKQRTSFASEDIVYSRPGEASSFTFKATPGKTLFRIDDNMSGITTRISSFDFLVSVIDIPFEPEKGDHIVYNGGIYEVLAPNDEPVWRWSSASMDTLRIHTKYVGEANEQSDNH